VEVTNIVNLNTTDIEKSPSIGLNILLVDDDLLVAGFLESYLTDYNYNVNTVHNGLLALEKLVEQPFDLVITDQSMPEMTGIELSEKIRESYPNLPIILSSGYSDDIFEDDIKKVGINHFHKKSSSTEELIKAITKLVN